MARVIPRDVVERYEALQQRRRLANRDWHRKRYCPWCVWINGSLMARFFEEDLAQDWAERLRKYTGAIEVKYMPGKWQR